MISPRSGGKSLEHADTDMKTNRGEQEVNVDGMLNSLESALRAESWIGARRSDGERGEVASFLRQKLTTWVRVETGMQVNVALASELFPPPEAAFELPGRPFNSTMCLMEVLQPGEVKIRCNVPPMWRPLLNSMRALAGRHWRHSAEDATIFMASRQAVALPGNSIHATLLLTQPPFVWVMQAVSTVGGARVVHFFSFPECLSNPMAAFVARMLCQVMRRNEWLILKALTNRQSVMARQVAASFYVVLTLKKCSAGSPFLPKTAAAVCDNPLAEDWYQLSYDEFTFPIYLRSFFRIVNMGAYKVFESLHGRSIAPYQAVVKRADWIQCREQFFAIFNVAGLVYRRVLKADKPKILDTVEPREVDGPALSDEPEPDGRQPCPQMRIRVRNTFLDFAEISDDDADIGAPSTQARSLSELLCVQ